MLVARHQQEVELHYCYADKFYDYYSPAARTSS